MREMRTGQRFPLKLPIKLHNKETQSDFQGVTGDLSTAAVYMRAQTELEAGAQVEFEIRLPAQLTAGADNVVMQCRGRVVRTESPDESGARGVACVIDSYDLVREP
jgi:hypothetical protein